jgi:FAD/FMN-containing dehydrogenase
MPPSERAPLKSQAAVEPGVINLELSKASAPEGYYFAPDPSSQMVSTVGGNLAENAGGPHCFKYGMTSNHIVALEVVLPDGETVELGSRTADCPGYDLVGVFVGSESTSQAVLKLSRLPKAVKTLLAAFPTLKDACGGNLHPILLFGRNKEGEEERVLELAREMLEICIAAGGTLSGEHGIGSEKNEYMGMVFSEEDLEAMMRLRRVFNPESQRHCRITGRRRD